MVALVAKVLLLMVLGACPRLLWPGLGGLLVHQLWWLWFPLLAEVASGDADGGMMLAMVCLMPGLYPVLVCVGFVGDGAGGDGVGEGVVLA